MPTHSSSPTGLTRIIRTMKGVFARVIDFQVEYAQSLIDDFSSPDTRPAYRNLRGHAGHRALIFRKS